MKTFSDVIDKLGGYAAVADALGLPRGTVSAMKTRNSVSAEHWPALVKLAAACNCPRVTLELLAGMASPRRRSSSPVPSTEVAA